MDALLQMFSRGVDQLLGRAGGPLHFRLLMMPIVVTTLAVLAGMKDAREGQPAFLWALITRPSERLTLIRSLIKDVGRVFIVAVVLDTTYQIMVFRMFYPVQVLIVAVACAIVPYLLIRGPVARLMRRIYRNRAAASRRKRGNP